MIKTKELKIKEKTEAQGDIIHGSAFEHVCRPESKLTKTNQIKEMDLEALEQLKSISVSCVREKILKLQQGKGFLHGSLKPF